MRLRENAVYIRLATTRDLHDDGSCSAIVAQCEAVAGRPFETFRDLAAIRASEFDLNLVRAEEIDALAGSGIFRRVRFRLGAGDAFTLEWNAGTHPYSGVYVTQIDVRFGYSLFEQRDVSGVDALFGDWVERLVPLWAHAHDADDNGIQNAAFDSLVSLGYGVDPASLGPDRPGREVSRGEFRYAVNWRTWLSAAQLEHLAPFADEAVLRAAIRPDGGALFRLPGHPADADAARDEQRRLRQSLAIDAMADKERWTHGYWQRTRTNDAR